MFHRRTLALTLLPLLAAFPACSQTPSAPAPSAAAPTPAQSPSQILIKALLAETDEAALNKLFPIPPVGTDFPTVPAQGQPTGARIGLLDPEISAALRQLAADSQLTILGRPYLLTTPDLRAQLKVGQELPYIASFKPHNPADPATAYDPELKHYFTGIDLSCTAHVLRDSLISMDVDFSANQLLRMDLQPAPGVPAAQQLETMTPIFQTTSAKTRVALKNNDTVILIAGHSPANPQPPAGGQPPAHAKIQLLFLTPHLAILPDGTPAPTPPDVLAPLSPKPS